MLGTSSAAKKLELANKLHCVVLGPYSSTTLRRMACESDDQATLDQEICLYSTQATATEIRNNAQFPNAKWISVHHAIGTDDELAGEIARELSMRGVTADRHSIVLISEWDTDYGRQMDETFRFALKLEAGLPTGRSDDGRIRLVSYLRGLDGLIPSETSRSESQVKTSSESRPAPENPAVGQPQVDYVQRFVEELKLELAATRDEKIRAIGVLGSDVYDKLLVLRALRSQFPTALFFTTDLDAQLIDRSQFAWAHNLLTASHYDLKLASGLQGAIPPFRDSYQTALFVGCLKALSEKRVILTNVTSEALEQDQYLSTFVHRQAGIKVDPPKSNKAQVLLFEVARDGAFSLTQLGDRHPLHPPGLWSYQKNRWRRVSWLFAGGLFLAYLYLGCRFCSLKQGEQSTSRALVFWLGLTPDLLALLGLTALLSPWKESPLFTRWDPDVVLRCCLALILWAILRPFFHTLLREAVQPALRAVAFTGGNFVSAHGHWRIWAILGPFSHTFLREVVQPALRAVGFTGGNFVSAHGNWRIRVLLAVALLIVLVWIVVEVDQYSPEGEPFAWFQGISIWPTMIIRVPLFGFCAYSIYWMAEQSRRSQHEIETALLHVNTGRSLEKKKQSWWAVAAELLRCIFTGVYSDRRTRSNKKAWGHYRRLSLFRPRLVRVLFMLVPLVVLTLILCWIYGIDPAQARSMPGSVASYVSLPVTTALVAALTLFVLDEVMSCRLLLEQLRLPRAKWSKRVIGAAARDLGIVFTSADEASLRQLVRDALDIRVLVRQSDVIAYFVYFPAVALAMWFLARNSLFDNWGWSQPFLLPMLIVFGILLFSAYLLGNTARRARESAVDDLNRIVLAMPHDENRKHAQELQKALEGIPSRAARPLLRHPIITAALLPFGGLSGLPLLQALIDGVQQLPH
jgi:hypothetical protein